MILLDCTLRDGGYYNGWDFDEALVQEYIAAMLKTKVDYIELGFRFYDKQNYSGPYAYTTDEYIRKLNIPEELNVGVMINFKDILCSPESLGLTLDSLFSKQVDSPVKLIRIASHFDKILLTKETTLYLKKLGYTIGLNIMQANDCSEKDLKHVSKKISKWNSVDVLYFADSMGNMQENDIERTIKTLRSSWNGPIGLHAHNNMGQAEFNAFKALENGVEWIDATILGMGRGAGNLKLENFLVRLNEEKYKPDALYELVCGKFKNLKEEYEWGENIFYYLSAQYNIHPTYVQEMQSNVGYSTSDKIGVLNYLHRVGGKSFNHQTLNKAVVSNASLSSGEWDSTDWTRGKDVLIIADGPSLKNYINDLEFFIKRKDLIVISLNYIESLPPELVDVYASCYITKIISQFQSLVNLDKQLLIPVDALPIELKNNLKKKKVCNYGMFVEDNILKDEKNKCTIPYPLVFAYSLSSIMNTETNKIYMLGFDGYSFKDYRNNNMEKVLSLFNTNCPEKKIISLSPTVYNVQKNSIYNPHI